MESEEEPGLNCRSETLLLEGCGGASLTKLGKHFGAVQPTFLSSSNGEKNHSSSYLVKVTIVL